MIDSDRPASHQVRAKRFGPCRRGLDPDQVYAYLVATADEMSRLERELTTAHTEVERMRQGLRQWLRRHVGCRFTDPHWTRPDARSPR